MLKIKSGFRRRKLGAKAFMVLFLSCAFCLAPFALFAQGEFIYDSKGKRDPFIPLVTADGRLINLEQLAGAEGLLLEGIIYDKSGVSYAVVNGEVVQTGDRLGEYQVLKVMDDKVIFLKEGEAVEVKLEKEE